MAAVLIRGLIAGFVISSIRPRRETYLEREARQGGHADHRAPAGGGPPLRGAGLGVVTGRSADRPGHHHGHDPCGGQHRHRASRAGRVPEAAQAHPPGDGSALDLPPPRDPRRPEHTLTGGHSGHILITVMGRPPIPRRVGCRFGGRGFRPIGRPARGLPVIALLLDELEALRLADLEGLYHQQAAERMGVSRATFGRILGSARRKVARALVEEAVLAVGEGPVVPADTGPCGGRRPGRRKDGCRGAASPPRAENDVSTDKQGGSSS